MDPEETTPSKGKKFLKITLITIAVLGAVIAVLSLIQVDVPQLEAPTKQVSTIKTYSEEEKTRLLEDLMKNASTSTISETEKTRMLKNLQAQTPKSTLSEDEKSKLLQNLMGQAITQ